MENKKTASTAGTPRLLEYKGRKIELLDDPDHVHIKIDGEHLHASRLSPGSYHSHMFMYQDFPDLETLAKTLVDNQGSLWLPAGHPVGHPLGGKRQPAARKTAKKKSRKR